MKILLAVPSKNRVDVMLKYTWQWLKLLGVRFDVAVFVEPQDFELYQVAGISFLKVLPENNKGMAYVKSYIKEYAKQNGYDLVFKIDDDIKSFTDFRKRTDAEGTAKILYDFILKTLDIFETQTELGAIAFPYSFHLFEEKEWQTAKKLQTSYIVRTEFFTHDKLNFTVFEDFAVALDILVSGKKVLKYGLIGIEMGVAVGEGESGGFQDFDRSELALKDAENLRKLYPPLTFKRVDKNWKIEPDMRSIKV